MTVSEALNLAGEVPKNRVHCHPEQAVPKEVREEPLAVSVFSGWVLEAKAHGWNSANRGYPLLAKFTLSEMPRFLRAVYP